MTENVENTLDTYQIFEEISMNDRMGPMARAAPRDISSRMRSRQKS
jgi:hypothetical protein